MSVNLGELKRRRIIKSVRALKNQCLRNRFVISTWLELVAVLKELENLEDRGDGKLREQASVCFNRLRDCCKENGIKFDIDSYSNLRQFVDPDS